MQGSEAFREGLVSTEGRDPGDSKSFLGLCRKVINLTWSLRGACEPGCDCHDWYHLRALNLVGVNVANNGSEEEKVEMAALIRRGLQAVPWLPLRDDDVLRPRLLCLDSLCYLGYAAEAWAMAEPHLQNDAEIMRRGDLEMSVFVLGQRAQFLALAAIQQESQEVGKSARQRGGCVDCADLASPPPHASPPICLVRRAAAAAGGGEMTMMMMTLMLVVVVVAA